MNLQEHIRKVLREEDNRKTQSLLHLIKQNGLYHFMEMSNVSIEDIVQQVEELPREVVEQYIIDFVYDRGYGVIWDNRKRMLVLGFFEPNRSVDYITSDGKTLHVEISEYEDDMDEPVDVYTTTSKNLSDEVIMDIAYDITKHRI
jgi:hypothetical protein